MAVFIATYADESRQKIEVLTTVMDVTEKDIWKMAASRAIETGEERGTFLVTLELRSES